MSELRKDERKKMVAFMPVYELHQNRLIGYLGDLTLQGALVVGETALEVGKRMTLGIEFRPTPETPLTRMVFTVRVAWSRQEGNNRECNNGVEFIELSKEKKELIEAILERYQFRTVGEA